MDPRVEFSLYFIGSAVFVCIAGLGLLALKAIQDERARRRPRGVMVSPLGSATRPQEHPAMTPQLALVVYLAAGVVGLSVLVSAIVLVAAVCIHVQSLRSDARIDRAARRLAAMPRRESLADDLDVELDRLLGPVARLEALWTLPARSHA